MTMLAVQVEVNGKKLVVAGAKDLALLSAYVAAVGLLGDDTADFGPNKWGAPDIHLTVTGITSRASSQNAHHNWITKLALKAGDTITLRFVKAEEADPPAESSNTPTREELAAAAVKERRALSRSTKRAQKRRSSNPG
jgi:hypothetical protein